MGDRTSVTLSVLKEQYIEAACFFGDFEPDHIASDDVGFSHVSFYEVNYGDLPFLDDLQMAGIAFDSHWDPGSEYGSGTEYCRFLSDGTVWRTSVSDAYVNPDLGKCMDLLDKPDELKTYITNHYNEVTPPSWDHQIEYGKLYKAYQLINPD